MTSSSKRRAGPHLAPVVRIRTTVGDLVNAAWEAVPAPRPDKPDQVATLLTLPRLARRLSRPIRFTDPHPPHGPLPQAA